MSDLPHRLKALERLRGKGNKRLDVTVELTADGQHYLLSDEGRSLIGNRVQFDAWMAENNCHAIVLENLTAEGSEMVQKIISGERTTTKERT